MTAHANAPVIIKRKKIVGGGGHHGGAWKVAYADFVTAMMAFFLLMWLLGATNENQRKGIADYFNPTITINRVSGGGTGSFNGDTVFSEDRLAQSGVGATQTYHADSDKSRGETGTDISKAESTDGTTNDEQLTELAELLMARSGESMLDDALSRHILTRVTDEGLIVELFDLPDEPLFDGESDVPTPLMNELTGIVSSVFGLARNKIAVGGHVHSEPIVRLNNPVWDISTQRAHRVRGMLNPAFIPENRVQRVTGHADRNLVTDNPMSVRNNRIELTLLR
jgi:chemotaxis protein MotB